MMTRELGDAIIHPVPAGRPEALASRPDFTLGDAVIRPAIRMVEGPGGAISVEPRVMQVLLTLSDAGGAVVTRTAIERACWGGALVGDDSINRAIAGVRRAARRSGSGFEVETIPRTGYRLLPEGQVLPPLPPEPVATTARPMSRRRLLVAGATALAGTGGAAWWFGRQRDIDPRVDALLGQAEQAWRLGLPESDAQGVGFAREAVRLAPDDPRAWGWFAFLQRNAIDYAGPERMARLVAASEASARRALLLEPMEGNALTALATLPPLFGDWNGARQRLTDVVRVAPENPRALDHLGLVEASSGRFQAAQAITEQLVERDPLAAVYAHKQVYRLWTLGRLAEMDGAADRALALWPLNPAVWLARLWTLAFTGRVAAALALLEENARNWKLPPPLAKLFRTTFMAIERRDPVLTTEAAAANLRFAARGPGPCVTAVNHLAALRAIDEAFVALEGYLCRRGPLVINGGFPDAFPTMNEMHWRKTLNLFLPVTAPLRADVRFRRLMEDIGLAAAWRSSGLPPDDPVVREALAR